MTATVADELVVRRRDVPRAQELLGSSHHKQISTTRDISEFPRSVCMVAEYHFNISTSTSALLALCDGSPTVSNIFYVKLFHVVVMNPLPGPSTPNQNVYQARTHFREKRGIFSMGGANSRNQEKGVILQAWVREILKKGKIWHVFINIYLFCLFE